MIPDSKMTLCKNNCCLNWKFKKTWIYLKNKSKEQCKINKSSCPYSIKDITRGTLRTLCIYEKNEYDNDLDLGLLEENGQTSIFEKPHYRHDSLTSTTFREIKNIHYSLHNFHATTSQTYKLILVAEYTYYSFYNYKINIYYWAIL